MRINISIDIEDAVRQALADHIQETVYCLPLPESLSVPCVAVSCTGGDSVDTIDTFQVSLDSRAELEEDALELLRRSIGILQAVARQSNTPIRTVRINSIYSWGYDPARPDLALCGSTLLVTTHQETMEIEES